MYAFICFHLSQVERSCDHHRAYAALPSNGLAILVENAGFTKLKDDIFRYPLEHLIMFSTRSSTMDQLWSHRTGLFPPNAYDPTVFGL